ncbi:MAG: hypothetical protein AAFR57_07105 [Pseudomonadota bacterium]
MFKTHHTSGPTGCPFPGARPTKAQREEDAFMEAHGGAGSRLVHRVVNAIIACADADPLPQDRIDRIKEHATQAVRTAATGRTP